MIQLSTGIEILSDTAVSPHPAYDDTRTTFCCVHPWLMSDGSILCAYRAGREKHSRDGMLLIQRSADGGLTWSPPAVIHDGMTDPVISGELESVHSGQVFELPDGRVAAIFKTVEAKKPDAYIFSEEGRSLRTQLYVAYSENGGRAWDRPQQRAMTGGPRDTYLGTTPLVLRDDGATLLFVEATGPDKEQYVMITSTCDGARTFAPLCECAHDASGAIGLGDARVTRLPNGHLVMLMWAYDVATEKTLCVHRCASYDDGQTWSKPLSTGLPSQIMTPLALDNRRMIGVSNVRVPPEGIYLWFSDDAGKSWNSDSPIMMWDDRHDRMIGLPLNGCNGGVNEKEKVWSDLPAFRFGMPDLLRLGEDEFLLTYYSLVNGSSNVRACRFRVHWPI